MGCSYGSVGFFVVSSIEAKGMAKEWLELVLFFLVWLGFGWSLEGGSLSSSSIVRSMILLVFEYSCRKEGWMKMICSLAGHVQSPPFLTIILNLLIGVTEFVVDDDRLFRRRRLQHSQELIRISGMTRPIELRLDNDEIP